MKFIARILMIFGLLLMLPLLFLILLFFLSWFGVDDWGYLTRFSSWFFAGILASPGFKLLTYSADEPDERKRKFGQRFP